MRNDHPKCPACDARYTNLELVCRLNKDKISITSDSQYSRRLQGACYKCNQCSHIFNHLSGSLNDFYSDDYALLTQEAEQDQQLFFPNNQKLYRSNFQAQIICNLLSQLSERGFSSILEVGAGKGLTAQKFMKLYPAASYFLHEVSPDKYIPFWNNIASSCTPDNGQSKHDLVVSFFTLEHCPISEISSSYLSRVTDKGVVLLTVPNLLENAGDLVVADHINHFTYDSLFSLFSKRFGSQFNFAISKDLYPRSLTILLSSHLEASTLKSVLTSVANNILPSQPKEESLDQLLLQLSNANQFIDWFIEHQKVAKDSKFALWGSGFYAKFFGLHMPDLLPFACFDSNSDLVGSKFIFADGSHVLIQDSNNIVNHCLDNAIHSVLLSVSPQAANSIEYNFSETFRENGIQLLNPWSIH